MSYTLVLNSSNVVGNNNNTFRYNFLSGNFTTKNSEMCISNIVIPYSWYNISSTYANNLLTLEFPTAAFTYVLNIVFPDGFYSVNDIQNYIELQCQALGLYLIDSTGNYVYFVKLSYNVAYYAVQLIAFVVPQLVSLVGLGYTQPTSGIYSTLGTGLPTIAQTPQFQFSSVGSISTILGFVAGQNYPVAMPQLTSYNINSPNVPIGSTVNSIVVQCNLVSNAVSVPSDILDGIPITSSFGTNINYQPSFPKFVKIKDGTYNSFTITFSDQNLNTLFARDPNVSIVLMLKNNV